MNVRVLFFGPLVDITGSSAVEITLSDSPSVQSLLDAVFLKWPALRAWDANLLTAVNLAYAARGEPIPPGAAAITISSAMSGNTAC